MNWACRRCGRGTNAGISNIVVGRAGRHRPVGGPGRRGGGVSIAAGEGDRSVPAGVHARRARPRANPDKLTYASQGVGSTAFLTAKLFETRAGIKLVHVPYRGAGPALNDIVAGHVDMMFDTAATSSPLHRAGSARILAIADLERSGALPQVPTFAESGLPGFRSITWFACAAPPGTPASTAEKIHKDFVEIVGQPEVSAKLNELMLEPVASTPAQAAQFFVEEIALWGRLIRDTGAKAQ
jgi:tripartite-type tricarboxylate transporter receptor subunit TctC